MMNCRGILFSLFLITILVYPFQAISAEMLLFGIPGIANKKTLGDLWQPVLDDLSADIDMPVKAVFFDDYSGATKAMQAGELHLAWMGNKHAIETVKKSDSEIFAQVVNVIGVPGYYSLLITQGSRHYANAEDVMKDFQSINFGFGDRHSTSGTTVPLYYLFGKQMRNTSELKSFRYANHEQNFLDIVDGKVDVATVSSIMMQRLKEKYPDKFQQVKVIWSSPLIPSDPLMWSNQLDLSLKNKIKAFFISYGTETAEKTPEKIALEKANLSRMKYSGFMVSTNKQLTYVLILHHFGKLQAIKSDSRLSKDDKQLRIKQVEQEIKDIESGKKKL